MKVPASPLRIIDIEVQGELDCQVARIYTRADAGSKTDGLIVFFHGGGFVAGGLVESDRLLRSLAERHPGQLILAASYTLATVRPFPAAAEDAHAVLLWSIKNKAKLGWNGKQLIVAGIEAGANLAAVCALMARDRGCPALTGQILIMPMLDPGLSTYSMRALPACPDMAEVANECAAAYRDYLPNASDRTHPYASPLQSSRLKNLPPALILSCEADPLRDEAEQYGAKLSACGVRTTVCRMPQAPLQEPGARNACACDSNALREIDAFIQAMESPPAATESPPATTESPPAT
jgi:acetyl esterase